MEKRQEIVQELLEICPQIADLQPVNLYAVPEGYFEGLSAFVAEKIRIEAVLPHEMVHTYGVPDGYFDGLAGNILSKIKSGNHEIRAELDEVAPLLNTISKANVYAVPAAYFAETDFTVAVKTNKSETRIITMRRANRWMQYMAAAMMTGILVTGAFLFTDNKTNIEGEQNERLDISSELNKLSADELVTYSNNPEHAIAAPATTMLASEAELVDIQKNIRQLSDEELNQYLKENSGPFDTVAEKE